MFVFAVHESGNFSHHSLQRSIFVVFTLLVLWISSVGGRSETESSDVEGRRILRYPDSHQLFVGNLPHDIDESELKDFFMSKCAPWPTLFLVLECHKHLLGLFPTPAYGNVVELRINTKGVGGKLPNFGFVVFDDSDPVQRILGAKVEGACIDVSLPTHFFGFGLDLSLTH